MEQHQYEEILNQIDDLIATLNEHEGELYVAIEIAHHLRDEVAQVEPESVDEDE